MKKRLSRCVEEHWCIRNLKCLYGDVLKTSSAHSLPLKEMLVILFSGSKTNGRHNDGGIKRSAGVKVVTIPSQH